MAVTFDASASADSHNVSVNTLTLNTISVGTANCLAIIFSNTSTVLPTFSSVAWGGQTVPNTPDVVQSSAGGSMSMWAFLPGGNLTPGAQNLVLNWSSAPANAIVYAASFNNVASITPASFTNTQTNISNSIASGSGHIAVDGICQITGNINSSGGGVQNQLLIQNAFNVALGASYIANQATANFGWTFSGNFVYAHTLIDLVPIGSAVGRVVGGLLGD